MIACFDVYYRDAGATVAGVLFEAWTAELASAEFTLEIDAVADYVPGQFYRRELPCLLALIERIRQPIDLIVIDGYVSLGMSGKHGLGMYLYEALGEKIPIVGVAKSRFGGTLVSAEITRGASLSPLYVTAVGIDLNTAKVHIKSMHGDYRMPTLLKRVDQLSRGMG